LPEGPLIRRARDDDAAATARLLYLTSPGGFTLFGGSERGGLRLIERAFATPGNDCAREVITLAELGGEVAGVLSAFPADEGAERRRHFIRVTLRHRPPWRWLRIVRLGRAGSRRSPAPPPGSFYIDSLATGGRFRRRGVAQALLAEAERLARERGLGSLALDTRESNSGARALYERLGFEVSARVPGAPPIPALVGYVKRLG
jgi:ribosomal protein S18 acetylase RimI-like enzyme